MEITNIKESGTNNILRWAISSNADLKNDLQLQSLINDETFYHITISNVNFLELFRFSQTYRNKVRVLDEKQAKIPLRKELLKVFPGEETTKDGEKLSLVEASEVVIQKFIDLALQMQSDDDIIRPETARLFLPMISRQFDIQIPISFMDLICAIPDKLCPILFNSKYPSNINDVIFGDDKDIVSMLTFYIFKNTQMIRYDKHYEDLLKVTKYGLLKNTKSERLYKFRLLGFYKYDNVNRSEIRCTMFKPDKTAMNDAMKNMARLQTGLKFEFAVQLPIQYMWMLENHFDPESLKITYDSSITDIISTGLTFDDFITQEFDDKEDMIIERNNSIDAYQTRISECNQATLNTIGVLANSSNDIDLTSAFALLPSIYNTKAVLTLDIDYADLYVSHYDPLIVDMFYQMLDMANGIINEIVSMK